MPRQPRLDVIGMYYHVISRGIERREIFRDKKDRIEFLKRLELALKETQCMCYAWVLMDNHFHLLVRPLKEPLSKMMRKLMSGYVGYYNARHKRVGSLFQNRYKSILCQKHSYFKELIRYIHLNPVRAGIVRIPSELVNYPWSGHSYLLGKRNNSWHSTEEVLSHFGDRKKDARKMYLEFIKNGWNIGYQKNLVGGGLVRSAGGMGGVFELKRQNIKWLSDARILGDGDFVSDILKEAGEVEDLKTLMQGKFDVKSLGKRICDDFEISDYDLFSGRRLRRLSLAKGVFVYLGVDYLGLTYEKIGGLLGMSSVAAMKHRRKGEEYIKENSKYVNKLIC